MPLEIMIDTKKPKGVLKQSTLKRMNQLEELVSDIPELSRPISIVSLFKYSKQAYYNGNPKFYQLPSTQERNFILSYAKNNDDKTNLLKDFVVNLALINAIGIWCFLAFKITFGHISESTRKILSGFHKFKNFSIKKGTS